MVSEKKLAICHNKGFHMKFDNGWTISVQFGAGNYCNNYNSMDYDMKTGAESDNAEVWSWGPDGQNYPEEPTNKSTPEEIYKLMTKIRKFKANETFAYEKEGDGGQDGSN